MATPNIVPRADSEGGLGTASKYWGSAYIDNIFVSSGFVGRDADNNVDFSVDDRIQFEIAGSIRTKMTSSTFFPATNDGVSLGTASGQWSDLFLASGAVINFNNGDVTLTHSSNTLTINDNTELAVGNSQDLKIVHDTANSKIENDTGQLTILNTANGKDIILKTDDGTGGVADYIRLDGTDTNIQISKDMQFADTVDIKLGSGNDCTLMHDGTDTWIDNGTGDLKIRNQTNSGDIIFYSDDGTGGVTEYLRVDGGATAIVSSKSIYTADNKRFYAGGGGDLAIYHDGTNSYISNITGDLQIISNKQDKDIIFKGDDGQASDNTVATYFFLDGSSATHDGSATTALYTNWPDKSYITLGTSHDLQLYHDGTNTHFANYEGGFFITQHVNDGNMNFRSDNGAGGFATYFYLSGSSATHDGSNTTKLVTNWPDKSHIALGDSNDLEIYHDGTNSEIVNLTGNLNIKNTANHADIIFFGDDGSTGTTAYLTIDGSAVKILMHKSTVFTGGGMDYGVDGTGADVIFYGDTAGRNMKWDQSEDHLLFKDDTKLKLGTGGDLEIYHDGSHSRIKDAGTGHLVINATDFVVNNSGDTKNMIIATDGGSVKLYHDNAAKIETTSTGINVTGAAEVAGGAGNGQLDVTRTSGATVGFQAQSAAGVVGTSSNHRLDIKTNGSTRVSISNTGDATFSNNVLMTNLPTSDPTTAGQLWNDSGTLKISAG